MSASPFIQTEKILTLGVPMKSNSIIKFFIIILSLTILTACAGSARIDEMIVQPERSLLANSIAAAKLGSDSLVGKIIVVNVTGGARKVYL